MGDSLKLSKERRHRSSSSLAAVVLDGTLSERKIDIKASIPEVDDQFAIAETRCEDLQEKIDLVKNLKRKRKLKKKSITRLADQQLSSENVPFISVRTQPKKKIMPQAVRLHRLETPLNPMMGYLDPTILEQHRITAKSNENTVHGVNRRLSHAGPTCRERGDGTCGQGVQITTMEPQRNQSGKKERQVPKYKRSKPLIEQLHHMKKKFLKQKSNRPSFDLKRKQDYKLTHSSSDSSLENVSHRSKDIGVSGGVDLSPNEQSKRRLAERRHKFKLSKNQEAVDLNDSIVELYNKKHIDNTQDVGQNIYEIEDCTIKPNREEPEVGVIEDSSDGTPPKVTSPLPKTKCRLRRHYELPTLSSSLKRSSSRISSGRIRGPQLPFIVTKSTAPSHNFGANIQQVLNKFKVRQSISGVPPTLAHHMGLSSEDGTASSCHSVPTYEINCIKLGKERLYFPTSKYKSYKQLLKLYGEGNTMVRKFLCSFDNAHSSYTSLYKVVTRNHEDLDGATSNGPGRQIRKQGLSMLSW